jgi:anaerobic ribonucleoside-triphosphate reductase activating protein
MRYNKIRKMDISNGPGVRVSIFLQGCAFNCKNCFNPETHDFNGGQPFDEETVNEVLKLCDNENVKGLSILGGEPLHPNNIKATEMLSKAFKEKFGDSKDVWVWTGFTFENIKDKGALKDIDVLVDGQYVDELHNPLLNWRGSSNQRILNVKETLKENKPVLYTKYYEK